MKPAARVTTFAEAKAILAKWEQEDDTLEAVLLAEIEREDQPVRDVAWSFPFDVEGV